MWNLFAIGGIDGEGISLYDSISSEALWQYDDGCQLRVRQSLGYGRENEGVGDPTRDVVRSCSAFGATCTAGGRRAIERPHPLPAEDRWLRNFIPN